MPGAPDARAQSYWLASRSPRYSLLFALPLLLAYEVLAVALPVRETQGVRNGAEVILRSLFDAAVGGWGAAAFGAVMLGLAALLVVRDIRANGAPSRIGVYVLMMLESTLLAAIFAVIVSLITARMLRALHQLAAGAPPALDAPTRLMVSFGAGIFEELLFRVVLVSALIVLARVVFSFGPRLSAAFAVVISAVVFSAFHYLGPFGEHFAIQTFLFRAVSGLLFSLIYVLRGFGIVAWTHSLYDVGVLVLSGP